MSEDYKEAPVQDTAPETADTPDTTAASSGLSDAGIMSIQGDAPDDPSQDEIVIEEQPEETPEKPEPDLQEQDADDQFPLRHTRFEETMGNVEDANERTVLERAPGLLGQEEDKEGDLKFENPEGSKIKPPEGWRPGGPEGGG